MITLKTQIKSIEGKDIKEVSLPGQFNEKIRPAIIARIKGFFISSTNILAIPFLESV